MSEIKIKTCAKMGCSHTFEVIGRGNRKYCDLHSTSKSKSNIEPVVETPNIETPVVEPVIEHVEIEIEPVIEILEVEEEQPASMSIWTEMMGMMDECKTSVFKWFEHKPRFDELHEKLKDAIFIDGIHTLNSLLTEPEPEEELEEDVEEPIDSVPDPVEEESDDPTYKVSATDFDALKNWSSGGTIVKTLNEPPITGSDNNSIKTINSLLKHRSNDSEKLPTNIDEINSIKTINSYLGKFPSGTEATDDTLLNQIKIVTNVVSSEYRHHLYLFPVDMALIVCRLIMSRVMRIQEYYTDGKITMEVDEFFRFRDTVSRSITRYSQTTKCGYIRGLNLGNNEPSSIDWKTDIDTYQKEFEYLIQKEFTTPKTLQIKRTNTTAPIDRVKISSTTPVKKKYKTRTTVKKDIPRKLDTDVIDLSFITEIGYIKKGRTIIEDVMKNSAYRSYSGERMKWNRDIISTRISYSLRIVFVEVNKKMYPIEWLTTEQFNKKWKTGKGFTNDLIHKAVENGKWVFEESND